MSQDELEQTDPARLADMMTLDETPPRLWSPEELGVILRHQLAVPLAIDLRDAAEEARSALDSAPVSLMTFADLLHHPAPEVAMLQRIKRFAKARKSNPNGPLPEEVATVIYYAAIAVALKRCQLRITSMDDAALVAGCGWVLLQAWVDDDTKALFRETLVCDHQST
jgi:hypothetical protein